jgi:hypothetical protein
MLLNVVLPCSCYRTYFSPYVYELAATNSSFYDIRKSHWEAVGHFMFLVIYRILKKKAGPSASAQQRGVERIRFGGRRDRFVV